MSETATLPALEQPPAPTVARKMAVLYGKKTVLFELEMRDIPQLVALHRGDKAGYMMRMCLKDMTDDEATRYLLMLLASGELAGWSVYAKQGRKSDCIGFAYLTDITKHSATLSGIMDRKAVHGLGRRVREGRYTYAEDVSRTLIEHCFTTLKLHRIDTMVRADNRRALLLQKKVGWKLEGTLREAHWHDGVYRDVVMLGLLQKDWRHE